MKVRKRVLSSLFLSGVALTGVHAQETVSATGGEASGSGGSSSYTIGQVSYTTDESAAYSMAQGVQQPYEISIVVGLDEVFGINLSMNVYPNPTVDFLTLNVDDFNNAELQYSLYDLNGKLLKNEALLSPETQISMKSYPTGNYFLKVASNNREVKSFKIIKN